MAPPTRHSYGFPFNVFLGTRYVVTAGSQSAPIDNLLKAHSRARDHPRGHRSLHQLNDLFQRLVDEFPIGLTKLPPNRS